MSTRRLRFRMKTRSRSTKTMVKKATAYSVQLPVHGIRVPVASRPEIDREARRSEGGPLQKPELDRRSSKAAEQSLETDTAWLE